MRGNANSLCPPSATHSAHDGPRLAGVPQRHTRSEGSDKSVAGIEIYDKFHCDHFGILGYKRVAVQLQLMSPPVRHKNSCRQT